MQTEQQSLRAAAGQRFWQIDALRGLALLNMLVYHAMYDWVYIFGHASGWYDIWSTHCHVWQQYICWSFILLSGYSFTLSRRPLKNGLLTAACAVVLTVATAVAMPEEVIWFGVLHLLGCAALLTCLLHPALEKLPPLAGVTGSAVLFALLNQLPQGWLGFEGTHLAALPAAWYKPNLFWLGLPDLTVFTHWGWHKVWVKKKEERIMNNGCVPPTASHFNQVSCSGKKHSSQSSQPILFAPLRAAHQHYSLFIIIYYFV